MSLCARLLHTLPNQLRTISRIKLKSMPHSNVRSQFHSFLIFQRSFCVCSRATSTKFDENRIDSTRYASGLANSSLRFVPLQLPSSHPNYLLKYYCSNVPQPEEKLSIFKRFKKMYKEYGYVLVPVHLVTSAIWFSSFYYLVKSGVDVAGLLESMGVGEKLVEKLRNTNSTMGYLTIALALYKIATPLRYTVTLGGTTLSIKYLRDWGYIKPIPPKEKLKEIIHDKKDKFIERKENFKRRFRKKRLLKKPSLKMGLKKGQED